MVSFFTRISPSRLFESFLDGGVVCLAELGIVLLPSCVGFVCNELDLYSNVSYAPSCNDNTPRKSFCKHFFVCKTPLLMIAVGHGFVVGGGITIVSINIYVCFCCLINSFFPVYLIKGLLRVFVLFPPTPK